MVIFGSLLRLSVAVFLLVGFVTVCFFASAMTDLIQWPRYTTLTSFFVLHLKISCAISLLSHTAVMAVLKCSQHYGYVLPEQPFWVGMVVGHLASILLVPASRRSLNTSTIDGVKHVHYWRKESETTKLTQELAVARSKGESLSVALNSKLKSKEWDLVWQEWRWEISKWTRLGGNQSSALGVYILSRGLHLCTLDLQISYAIVHEGTMRSIA